MQSKEQIQQRLDECIKLIEENYHLLTEKGLHQYRIEVKVLRQVLEIKKADDYGI
jgi:hypothetical protein